MKKIILLALVIGGGLCGNLFAETLVIDLNFPQKSYVKAEPPPALAEQKEISGRVTLDIAPYPEKAEADRYLVEYFVDNELVYKTTGAANPGGKEFVFAYTLDSARFDNGAHKIIVNFWDKEGPSAIGIEKVLINNETENE